MELSDRILRFEIGRKTTLLINPISGAIDLTPNGFISNPPASAREHLSERGYFLSEYERINRLHELRKINEKHSLNVPYWFYILTTLNCNFRCPICYERNTLTNSETNLKTIESVIDSIARFKEEQEIPNSRINLVIFGGEPLCVSNPGIVRKIFESSREKGWKDIIVTNGSAVGKYIELFTEYSNTISDLRVTLDGPKEIHDARRPYGTGSGSFDDVVEAIETLLENGLSVKMQTITGSGNIPRFNHLIDFVKGRGWLQNKNFQWRIEGSHDYANLDPEKDEVSEGKIVRRLIQAWREHSELRGKMRFESFKYLGHLVRSFGWLGDYKTYWGPKYEFCEPQKGFQYVYSTDGKIYHCPRTINNPDFCLGDAKSAISPRMNTELKHRSIIERAGCLPCSINTLCGGGCRLQKKCYSSLDCKEYALSVISEFVDLMKEEILERADRQKIVSINDCWMNQHSR
ncbi:MAG: radical SAM protein [Nanoarchaeota archaeon]